MNDEITKLFDNSRERLVGIKQVTRGIMEGSIRCVVIARNADSFIKSRLLALANANDVPILYCDDKAVLGRMCDIDVAASVVGFRE